MKNQRGFTFVEFIIVVGVLAVMATILVSLSIGGGEAQPARQILVEAESQGEVKPKDLDTAPTPTISWSGSDEFTEFEIGDVTVLDFEVKLACGDGLRTVDALRVYTQRVEAHPEWEVTGAPSVCLNSVGLVRMIWIHHRPKSK